MNINASSASQFFKNVVANVWSGPSNFEGLIKRHGLPTSQELNCHRIDRFEEGAVSTLAQTYQRHAPYALPNDIAWLVARLAYHCMEVESLLEYGYNEADYSVALSYVMLKGVDVLLSALKNNNFAEINGINDGVNIESWTKALKHIFFLHDSMRHPLSAADEYAGKREIGMLDWPQKLNLIENYFLALGAYGWGSVVTRLCNEFDPDNPSTLWDLAELSVQINEFSDHLSNLVGMIGNSLENSHNLDCLFGSQNIEETSNNNLRY